MILNLKQTNELAKELYRLYGYNILNYDLSFVQRALIKFSNIHKCVDYEALKKLLLEDETLIHQFFDKLFINVSEMFRDPEVFSVIREKIMPYIASHPTIKIWSAGCAKGQEIYSLAILLKEMGVYDRCILYATDIDITAVDKAREGKYKIKDGLKYFENYYLSGGKNKFSKYFTIKDDYMIVKDELKQNICFSTHNIITDESFNTFSLILCRNMFIYFDNDLQSKGLNTFKNSLEQSGFLVMGKSESLHFNGGYTYYQDYDEKNKIYKLKN
jgi:chemotaxis protein methyltransferase CheR